MILFKDGRLTIDQIRHALNAYTLICRQKKSEYLPVVEDRICEIKKITERLGDEK